MQSYFSCLGISVSGNYLRAEGLESYKILSFYRQKSNKTSKKIKNNFTPQVSIAKQSFINVNIAALKIFKVVELPPLLGYLRASNTDVNGIEGKSSRVHATNFRC